MDVASFGGPTREYQVRVDPDKLISYGLSIGQVEQQLTNNNANAGGSFIETGLQQINVREVGLVRNVHDIENTVIMTQERNAAPYQRHRRSCRRARKIRLGQFAQAIHLEDGNVSSTTTTWSQASCSCAKAPKRTRHSKAFTRR